MLKFKIIGMEALQKKCSADTIKKPLGEGIKKIIFALEGEVKVATPIGPSGFLRSETFSKYGASEGMVGTPMEYAPFVEYGTQYMEARHVVRGSSARVLGQGMFSYAFESIKKKMADFLKGIGIQIENKWGA